MNRFFTQVVLLFSLQLLFQISTQAQPKFTFKNAVKVSGTSLQTGAIYKFANVSTGVDARVTIKSMTGGITLTSIDDNSTGFDEAFQPFINVASSSSGYVEFQVDFVVAGTTTAKSQSIIPMTCIDVDGATYSDGKLYEQDQIQYFPGYYDFAMTGSNISVLNPTGWITIKNTSGSSYPGIDTTAKDVMATVVNSNISSFRLRIGATNTSPTQSEVRYRSVYFKEFSYPNSRLLPNRTLLSFSAAEKTNGIQISGLLSSGHTYDKIVIERGNTADNIMPIASLPITNHGDSEFPFTYLDADNEDGASFYRIRLVNSTEQFQEISNVLMVKMNIADKSLRLYNTVIQGNNPVITINSGKNEEAMLQVTDFAGRTLYKNKVTLNPGVNNISLNGSNMITGYGIAIIDVNGSRSSTKIFIQ